MSGALAIVGAAAVLYALSKGGNPLAALTQHGDTLLPSGQPAQMTAAQWAAWKQTTIAKYVGPTVASYQKSQDTRDFFSASIDARQLQRRKDARGNWIPDQCGGASGPGTLLTATARTGQVAGAATAGVQDVGQISSALSGTTQAATGLLKAIPVIGSIVGAITFGITAITQHHAQAETNETSYLCNYVPQANAALADIGARFRSGQISTPQAHDELENLFANFVAAVAPINKFGGASWTVSYGLGGQCDLACVYCLALRMICDVREQVDY